MSEAAAEPDSVENGGPEIVLICIGGDTYYLVEGNDHLHQILLADGEFPTPVLCVNFESKFEARRVIGESFNLSSYWAIHPEIFARLKDAGQLVETNA